MALRINKVHGQVGSFCDFALHLRFLDSITGCLHATWMAWPRMGLNPSTLLGIVCNTCSVRICGRTLLQLTFACGFSAHMPWYQLPRGYEQWLHSSAFQKRGKNRSTHSSVSQYTDSNRIYFVNRNQNWYRQNEICTSIFFWLTFLTFIIRWAPFWCKFNPSSTYFISKYHHFNQLKTTHTLLDARSTTEKYQRRIELRKCMVKSCV